MTVRENFEAIKTYLVETGAPEEMVDFIASRISQDEKAKANAKAKRLEKNGGVKKDPAYSEYYTNLRNAIMNVMTKEAQTGEQLAKAAGTKALSAQVGLALRPVVEDGTVVAEDVICEYTNNKGLVMQSVRTGYKRA